MKEIKSQEQAERGDFTLKIFDDNYDTIYIQVFYDKEYIKVFEHGAKLTEFFWGLNYEVEEN